VAKTPGPGWHKFESDGSVAMTCPRCGWWIKLTSRQALGKEVIECPRCHAFSDYLPRGMGGQAHVDFQYGTPPERQHKEKSGVKR